MVDMIDRYHVRWDFIGLSTDDKPTPEDNDQVVNGSTFYCSDTSKLYVWYDNNWWERIPTGSSAVAVPNNAWLNINATYISAT